MLSGQKFVHRCVRYATAKPEGISMKSTPMLLAMLLAVDAFLAVQQASLMRATVSLKAEPIQIADKALDGVDLGIADDHMYRRPVVWSTHPPYKPAEPNKKDLGFFKRQEETRPAIFIAWRNTDLIEEVEVRLRNLGSEEGRGEVSVDILDEEGRIELHLEPLSYNRTVSVPPRDQGGFEGKVVKMAADRRLNRLIDLYDRIRKPYSVRATVRTLGAVDANIRDNVKFKSFNVPFVAKPGFRHTYNYRFVSDAPGPRRVVWRLESTTLPDGWQLSGSPVPKEAFAYDPKTPLSGFVSFDIPATAKEGEMVELRASLVDAATGEVIQQKELFLAQDTTPPTMSEIRIRTQQAIQLQMAQGMVRIDLQVSDFGSGVLEASGVWIEFSTDDGRTFAQKSGAYATGNFVAPTSFIAEIGPFRSGTKVLMFIGAMDSAGNVARHTVEPIVVE
jgi:hypothetical protein